MARQKRTTGYAERLQMALERGPRPMSVRGLAKALQDRFPDLRGTSYGGVRQYAEGNVANPRIDLLRAMADVLGVRWQKIAYDEGALTEVQQRAEEAAAAIGGGAEARQAMDERLNSLLIELLPVMGDALAHSWEVVGHLLGAHISQTDTGTRLYGPAMADWMTKANPSREDLDVEEAVRTKGLREVAQAISAPAEALHLPLAKLTADQLDLYLTALAPALRVLLADSRQFRTFTFDTVRSLGVGQAEPQGKETDDAS